MKFDTPAATNPIDQHDVVQGHAYGFVLGSAMAKGRISAMHLDEAKRAPGVLAIVTTLDMPRLERGILNAAYLFGGPVIQHYHQAIAVVVAETFEHARAAAYLIHVEYQPEGGKYDLAAEAPTAKPVGADSGEGSSGPPEER